MNHLEKFLPLKAEITEVVTPLLSIRVVDFKTSEKAIESAKIVKEMGKRLDGLRREMVDPLNASVKAINEYAKQVGAALESAEGHLRNEINQFAVEQEKIRQAELARAEIERKRQEAELLEKQEAERAAHDEGAELFGDSGHTELQLKQEQEIAIQSAAFTQKTFDINQGQIKNTRKTLKVSIVNLKLVPEQFLIITLNEKMALAAHKGGLQEIAGLRFSTEISVAIGEKTRVTKESLGE